MTLILEMMVPFLRISLNNAQVQLNRTAAKAKRLGHQLKEDRVQVQHQL